MHLMELNCYFLQKVCEPAHPGGWAGCHLPREVFGVTEAVGG